MNDVCVLFHQQVITDHVYCHQWWRLSTHWCLSYLINRSCILLSVDETVKSVYKLCVMPLSCLINSRSCILLSADEVMETGDCLPADVLCTMSLSCFTNWWHMPLSLNGRGRESLYADVSSLHVVRDLSHQRALHTAVSE